LALPSIVGRRRLGRQFRLRADELEDGFGELDHRELDRIADIDRAGDVVGGVHHTDHAVDQVVDMAEGARPRAVAIDSDVVALQRLHAERWRRSAIVGMHARA
jgi:hypothetical protein